MRTRDKYRPAAPKSVRLFLAGATWIGVGIMLLSLAFSWLAVAEDVNQYAFIAVGLILGLLIHRFGFSRIADKNLARILPVDDKKCVFSFISWKSYLIIVVMITLGQILRRSPIPKPQLAILYIGIGLGLILSSIRYMRAFSKEIRKQDTKAKNTLPENR